MDLHSGVDFTLFYVSTNWYNVCGLDGEGIYGEGGWQILSQTLEVGMDFGQEALRITSKVEISRTSRPMVESCSKGGLIP